MSNGNYTLGWAIQKAYQRATRHVDTLTASSANYQALLEMADDFQRDWQDEPGVDWRSLYQQVAIGTVQLSTPSYSLPNTIRHLSNREEDSVILQITSGANSGETWFYDMINPDKLTEYRYKQACSILQDQLYFANSPENPIFPANDARLGAQITVPAYMYVKDLTSANQTIQVDDPMWLVYMMAAEFVRTDFVRQNQYPNLLAAAANKMEGMLQRNEDQRQEVPVDIDLFDIDPNTGLSSGAWY